MISGFDQTGPQRHREVRTVVAPVKLSTQQLRCLSQVNPLISAGHILLEWGAVFLAAALCQHWWNPLLYAGVVAFIGARQHAMLILMHDGAHHRLFRHRRLNDWVSELLLAWPHLGTMRAYRQHHRAHHSYVNSEKDPDWQRKKDSPEWHFPQSPASLGRIFLRDLSGFGAINLVRLASSMASAAPAPGRAFKRVRLAYYLVALGMVVGLGWSKAVLMYWGVPYFTWLILVMRIRSIAEHFAIEGGSDAYGQTRTTYAGPLARLFIAPKNINYHIEHHLFPSVPFYRLPQVHALLMSEPEYADAAHITTSYWQLILECLRQPAFKAAPTQGAPAGA